MKKNLLLKAAAVLTMLTLALVITVVPGTALADISAATITPGAGQSYNIPVGGTVDLTGAVTGTPLGVVSYSWAQSSASVSLSATTGATTTVTGLVPGTATTITLTASDAGGAPTVVTTSVTTNVVSMTISNSTLALNGGATQTLTVGNTSPASTTTWTTASPSSPRIR